MQDRAGFSVLSAHAGERIHAVVWGKLLGWQLSPDASSVSRLV
jgi:hypothetical protein